jgi:glycosyl hydrolase family 47
LLGIGWRCRIFGVAKNHEAIEKLFNDFVRYCRADAGYAALADVVTKQQRDEMESFARAETFKYFYLLFAPPDTLDFDKIVSNTEAHPLRRPS